jgi:hypothetical protein
VRDLPLIKGTWEQGGPFIGDRKPVTRVFVQLPWPDLANTTKENDFLRATTSTGVGKSGDRGVPMRWYQNTANSQSMVELPNVSTVTVDRTVDQDAASFSITLSNQWMFANSAQRSGVSAGQPGYFTPTRGDSMDARARWGHESNEWNDVLVPNALLRIYTGYGGDDVSITTAVANGNLALYGVFLVDEVRISTDGQITLTGRDMAKLLIEQQLFPPLVPAAKYPLSYNRWAYEDVRVRAAKKMVVLNPVVSGVTAGTKNCTYSDSSQDRWYGVDASIHGHRGSHSIDSDPNSFALSVGNSGPNRDFSTVWWEYWCGETMNAIHVHPWAGNYEMYVSIHDGNTWLGDNTVPYDAGHILATQDPAVDTGANIKYVAKFTVPHETARDYVLPQAYNAVKVRISFRNLFDSGIGPWRYRAGVREFRILGINVAGGTITSGTNTGNAIEYVPWTAAGASRIINGKPYSQGYGTNTILDQQDVFGDATRHTRTNRQGETLNGPISMAFTKTGNGYYQLSTHGEIRVHGDAVWYGDPETDGFTPEVGVGGEPDHTWDIALTHTGEGYWILTAGGHVFCYGDAVDYGFPVSTPAPLTTSSITAHPSAMGYWILRIDGSVHPRGAATSIGGFGTLPEGKLRVVDTGNFANGNEQANCIRSTSTGQGYWILTTKGRVEAFGDAKHHGQPTHLADHSKNIFTECYWKIMPGPTDEGYWLLHASGRVESYGDVDHFGGPIPGTNATLRRDGNYLDYMDIVKDLVRWSGFLFYNPALSSTAEAPIYGSLESTGAWSDERLPDEMFDKRPVIDAITQLREVVGYLAWVDAEGRFRFESPNWWKVGNFDENGNHVPTVPVIDDRVQLTAYTLSRSDDPLRSSIIISSHDPYADLSGTVSTKYTPANASRLRGLVKPAMWVNDFFVSKSEQKLMAELIGLHIAFQERIGQVDCVATPHIEINDQVRIYEQQTEEVYVHYIRGINFQHDLETGDYRMTLTTHWLAAGDDSMDIVGGEYFPASPELQLKMTQQILAKEYKDPGGRL